MKNQILIIIIAIISSSCSTTKLNSYGSDYSKIKTQAELISLKISDTIVSKVNITTTEDFDLLNKSIASELILEQIIKVPEYVDKIIKNRKKKFTQTYSGNNSLTFKSGLNIKKDFDSVIKLPIIELNRKIFANSINPNAIKIKFIPHQVNGNAFKKTDTLFVFKLDNIVTNYTKAKTTKKYPFVNLILEIKAIYYEKGTKSSYVEKEYTSSNITIPIKNGMNFKHFFSDYSFYSKPFRMNNLKTIEIKVTETNPYYLKLEELESNLNDNKSDLTDLLTKLLKKE